MIFSSVKKLSVPEGEVKQIERDGVVLWKKGYTNQVPLSIDTDGSIFNGTGYIDGYRLSSSGALKAQDKAVATGFIKASLSDTVRMAGVDWFARNGYNYFVIYDESYNLLGTFNYNAGSSLDSSNGVDYVTGIAIKAGTKISNKNGVTVFDTIVTKNNQDYAYIRISTYGAGSDMIVTVNEEIT